MAAPELDPLETLALSVLERLNEDLPPAERATVGPGSVILGEGGMLDSLGVANFIVGMEEGIELRFGRDVPLSDQDLVELFDEPSVTVARFAAYLRERMNG